MAKTTGLGDNFYVSGYDLSGDIAALQTIRTSMTLLDVTDITQSAHARLPGLRDGEISFNSWFDPAANQAHAVLSALPSTDITCLYCRGTTLGNVAAGINGKQVNYDPARAQDGSLMLTVQVLGNGNPLEWGQQLTAGDATVASAGNGTSVDLGIMGPSLTITGNTLANPTVVTTSTAHGLATGDSVNITGSNSTPSINGDNTVTVISSTTFSVPVNVTVAGTAGTVQRTSTGGGWAAYLQLFSIGSNSVTVTLQDSADNSSFTNLTGGAFSALSARGQQRLASSSSTAIVRRYARIVTSGTFTNAVIAVVFCRFAT